MDAGTMYIDWAIEQGFGVIDANIPEALTGNEVCLGGLTVSCGPSKLTWSLKNDDYSANKHTEELCIYMWDNYLEYIAPSSASLRSVRP